MKSLYCITLALVAPFFIAAADKKVVAKHLQDISVTIKAQSGYQKSEGSGVLILEEKKQQREVKK